MGPLNPTSKGGMRFVLTIVDNYSGYLSAFPLPSKDAATDTIKFDLENEAKNKQRYPIEIFSDGGGEFVNESLKNFLKSKSINHLVSEPYHSQHNGKAERANRTIMESLRSVFSSTKLPKNCWHVVVQSCCLALNQIPSEKGGPTPWEVFHKSKLPPDYLKPIGSSVVYLINQSNRSKLDEKGKEGIFIGYVPRFLSYKILSRSGKIVETKHVKFLKAQTFQDLPLSDDVEIAETSPTSKSAESLPVESTSPNEDPGTEDLTDLKPEISDLTDQDTSDTEDSSAGVLETLKPHLRDRSKLKGPERYGYHHEAPPKIIKEALKLPRWFPPIEKEFKTIEDLGVWEDADKAEVTNPLNTMWAFRSKEDLHLGKVALLRALLSYSVNKNLKILQFDVKGAFLHAPLEENVFIKTPEGSTRKSKYLKLNKSLYGLKQAPLNWYKTLSSWIKENGFEESNSDPCLYLHADNITALFFHVDDLVVVGDADGFKAKFLDRFKDSLAHGVDTLLGMKVDVGKDYIALSLRNHIKKGLEEMNLLEAKPMNNPCTSGLHLQPASENL